MATNSIAQAATQPTTPTTVVPKNSTVRLVGADGSLLRIQLKIHTKTGLISSAVVHSTARNGANKRTHATGARATHADMETAAKAVYALVVAAQKIGWQHPAKTVGAPKPDAFTASNLPAPGKAATVAGGKK